MKPTSENSGESGKEMLEVCLNLTDLNSFIVIPLNLLALSSYKQQLADRFEYNFTKHFLCAAY